VYIAWVISAPCNPSSPSFPLPPHFQAEPVLPLSLILLKRRNKHNKEYKVFLLVELRIAIQVYLIIAIVNGGKQILGVF
jgi:hypothetical protein